MVKPSRIPRPKVPKKKEREEGRENVAPTRRVERRYSARAPLGDKSRAVNTQPSSLDQPKKRKKPRVVTAPAAAGRATPQSIQSILTSPDSRPTSPQSQLLRITLPTILNLPSLPDFNPHPLNSPIVSTSAVAHVVSRNSSPTPCTSILFQSSVAGCQSGRNTPDTLNMPAFTHPNSPYVPWSSPIRRQICRPLRSSESILPRPSVSLSTRTRSGARAPEPPFIPTKRKLASSRLAWGLKAIQTSVHRKVKDAAKRLRGNRAAERRMAGVADQHVPVPTWSDGSTMSLESINSASLEDWLASRNSHDEGPDDLLDDEDDDHALTQEDGTLNSFDELYTPVHEYPAKEFVASTSTYGSLVPTGARRFTGAALDIMSGRSRSPSPLGMYRSRSPSPLGVPYQSRSPSPLGISFRSPSTPLPALPSVDELSNYDGERPVATWAEVSPATQYLRVPSASLSPRTTDARPVSWQAFA